MTQISQKNSKDSFKFPDCWDNDVRMDALFAPFRSRTINSTDWASKMKFWSNLIDSWCKYNECPEIELSKLSAAFSRKGKIPACLDIVLQNLLSSKILVPKEEFLVCNESWKGWAIKVFITNPVKWTLSTVKSSIIGKDIIDTVVFVHLPVVKHLGEELLKQIPLSYQGKLIELESLKKLIGSNEFESLPIVLQWLHNQGLVAILEENNKTLIKVPRKGEKPVITETDKGIHSLEQQQKILENNIKKLEVKKNSALDETKLHLNNNMKNMAKISLRRKKELEKTIEKRAQTLENIQSLLHKIDEVKTDSEVVECYKIGVTALKRVFKETGLNEDTVANTLKELEEVLEQEKEIEEALAKPLNKTLEQSLEEELNELLLKEAPNVPADDLTVENKKEIRTKSTLETKMEALSI